MTKDKGPQNLMLTIDQVSQLTGVRKSTLRYWEKSFEEFLKPARTQSNRREYTMEDLDLVKTIKRLLEEEHLTSEGVRLRLLKLYPHHGQSKGGGQEVKQEHPPSQGGTYRRKSKWKDRNPSQ
jgi:DNA-binding transcriptional MerR regulator|uniref:MerR family transcriptional regulator n=1 Tax=Desulfobacca acetoxidans TaxID=60893 RepID=A0A7C5EPT0_9BACT